MKTLKLSSIVCALVLLTTSANATLKSDKVTLKGNMIVELTKLPSSVNTIKDSFTNGVFYGRLRSNMFLWDWKEDNYPAGKLMDDKAMGIGGSFVHKTAPLHGISATAGLYTSQNPSWFREDIADVGYVKAGKDTFSRRDTSKTGNFGMTVVGQGYVQYDVRLSSIKAGRQMVETVFTKSNDTKMVPNTFDGVTLTSKDFYKTTLVLGYLAKQKLRDHTVSHDVLAFDPNDKWSQNDDAAVNRNLTVDRIGKENALLLASITNKSVKNLKLNVSYAMVPDVLSNLALEAHYTIPVTKNWKIAPGVRYMQQFDHLGANYDVANLLTKHDGYKQSARESLETNLLAVRLDIKNRAFLGRLGYSQIADQADIVTPWRAFPTGGFTRAMAQYNWFANTKTYMARAGYDFGKANILDGFTVMARYAIQDTDDKKYGVAGDSTVIHVDARQNIGKNLELKLRVGIVNYADDITGLKDDGTAFSKTDLSYNEYRFELNYLF